MKLANEQTRAGLSIGVSVCGYARDDDDSVCVCVAVAGWLCLCVCVCVCECAHTYCAKVV